MTTNILNTHRNIKVVQFMVNSFEQFWAGFLYSSCYCTAAEKTSLIIHAQFQDNYHLSFMENIENMSLRKVGSIPDYRN